MTFTFIYPSNNNYSHNVSYFHFVTTIVDPQLRPWIMLDCAAPIIFSFLFLFYPFKISFWTLKSGGWCHSVLLFITGTEHLLICTASLTCLVRQSLLLPVTLAVNISRNFALFHIIIFYKRVCRRGRPGLLIPQRTWSRELLFDYNSN